MFAKPGAPPQTAATIDARPVQLRGSRLARALLQLAGLVGQMTEALVAARANDRFLWLALSPEGTRSRTDGWRSGFYHVARAAAAPLALVGFDYARRVVDVDRFMGLGGEVVSDMAAIAAAVGNPVGRHPAGAALIRLRT